MIVVDNALMDRERAGKPIRVGLVGAGFAGKGFALQLLGGLPGMRLVAISNRTIAEAEQAVRMGNGTCTTVSSAEELEAAIDRNGNEVGKVAITSDAMLLCASPSIDCIVEATGEIEFAAQVAMAAFATRKTVVVLNAELDATLGPILRVKAQQCGAFFCQADGDQPAVIMNLYRYVKSIGFVPVMAGNIKSLQDHRRTPATQAEFARNVWQRPKFITSFADGTKISQEMATVANATGFPVQKRSMLGPRCDHVDNAWKCFDPQVLMSTGLTDYILGAQPSFGVFVLAHCEHQPMKKRWMKVYKMGDGPFYTFYTPSHLSPIEAPNTVGRAVIFRDDPVKPLGGPVCDVVTVAKRALKAGEVLDGIGGFLTYGAIDNTPVAMQQNLLPMGLSEGCILKRDLPMDAAITFDDVEMPKGRLCDRLWREQVEHFGLRKIKKIA
ncbi:NAD(P)H-dependent oxidoreductase [Fontivita pretiosa]|uniref:NAD(P)H-dependent oxidoreductase n=1 Tax=Fontivita pretiosa TaxID=2989684 RepID=UPI003D1775D6